MHKPNVHMQLTIMTIFAMKLKNLKFTSNSSKEWGTRTLYMWGDFIVEWEMSYSGLKRLSPTDAAAELKQELHLSLVSEQNDCSSSCSESKSIFLFCVCDSNTLP